MNEEQREWLATFVDLVNAGDWEGVIFHQRARVNLTKEVILSVDPEVQRTIYEALMPHLRRPA